MSYTFLDQQTKLSQLLGDSNTGTDDQFPLTIRKKELNRGELQYAKDTKIIHEKATGVVASAQIALPSDFLEIYTLVVNNYVITRDREISVKDWERWYNYSGNIAVYYISEESGVRYIKFLGSVNGLAYTLYYIKRPVTELSGDTEVSLFPEEFREAPVFYAASQLFQQLGKTQLADRYLSVYLKLVRDGQAYVENLYLDKMYAVPDTNMIGGFTNDIQGQGFDYSL